MLKLSVLMATHEQRESRKAFVVIELNGNHNLAWSFYLHGRQFLVMLRDYLGNVPEVELSFFSLIGSKQAFLQKNYSSNSNFRTLFLGIGYSKCLISRMIRKTRYHCRNCSRV